MFFDLLGLPLLLLLEITVVVQLNESLILLAVSPQMTPISFKKLIKRKKWKKTMVPLSLRSNVDAAVIGSEFGRHQCALIFRCDHVVSGQIRSVDAVDSSLNRHVH